MYSIITSTFNPFNLYVCVKAASQNYVLTIKEL
uniref:Uncharacterized protein n=1 Tax=Arundo donax TaxID=35708 RepID=A0A0A9F654_ARUDO